MFSFPSCACACACARARMCVPPTRHDIAISSLRLLLSLSLFFPNRSPPHTYGHVLTCVHATRSQPGAGFFLPSFFFFIAPSIINSGNTRIYARAHVLARERHFSGSRVPRPDKNGRRRGSLFIIKFLYGFTSLSTTRWCNGRRTHTSRSPLSYARLRYTLLPPRSPGDYHSRSNNRACVRESARARVRVYVCCPFTHRISRRVYCFALARSPAQGAIRDFLRRAACHLGLSLARR